MNGNIFVIRYEEMSLKNACSFLEYYNGWFDGDSRSVILANNRE